MKVSLNWLKDYLPIEKDAEEIGKILTDTGLEVEHIEEQYPIAGGLKGLVVGKVVTCEKHPNADRLSVTTVDIGQEKLLNIVCGAPNVATGQKVVIAPVGATIYPIEGESWTIKKGKIRGMASEGMICAEDEIGLGKSHDGIMILDDEAVIGQAVVKHLGLEPDYVFEIGLTPNRSDATNHLGVALDLAASLKINHGFTGKFAKPSLEIIPETPNKYNLSILVENEQDCPRYSGIVIDEITVRESPDWLKKRLGSIGVRPINNVVDITNFVLHEMGQPLHAFDLDAIENKKIKVQKLPEGSKFFTLDGIERTLSNQDLMICDGNNQPMCIGGVFGGLNSGVKERTTAIFLESAHFNPTTIRKTSMHHNLRTDAAKIYEKGSDPNITIKALQRASQLIKECCGGKFASPLLDYYPKPINEHEIALNLDNINHLIGVQLPFEQIKNILSALEISITHQEGTHFKVSIPTNKSDVKREADVIEEILRIYGFNNVPVPSSMSFNHGQAISNQHGFKESIANLLTGMGFTETMSLSLGESKKYLTIPDWFSKKDLVYIQNTSNIHLDIMRPEMLFSMLSSISHNLNRQQSNLQLFEFGSIYFNASDKLEESRQLGIGLTGDIWKESWQVSKKHSPTPYYYLKAVVENIFSKSGITAIKCEEKEHPALDFGLTFKKGRAIGYIGQVKESILKIFGIKQSVLFSSLDWDGLLQFKPKKNVTFQPISKFPSVRRDLAIVVDNSVNFIDIELIANKVGKKILNSVNLFDVYKNSDQLGKGKKSYAVSFTFEDQEKTLKDQEIDRIMNKLINEFERQLNASIRR